MRLTLLIICSLFIISCAGGSTGKLWKNPVYKEKVESFLISDDSEKLVIIGNKYHYIFELDHDLKKILLSKNKSQLKARFSLFKVNGNNVVSGKYYLNYIGNNKEYRDWLNKVGFESRINRDRTVFSYSGSMIGQRYTANKKIITTNNFNKQYTLRVEEPSTLSIGKVLATPIAVVADGVKLAASIYLVPLVLIFVSR